jgi:hypothetical protein
MEAQRIFVGGIVEGVNYPKGRDKNKPIIDLEDCKDIIIVDRKYFLENKGFIYNWAMEAEKLVEPQTLSMKE